MSENAKWYIPSLNSVNIELPENVYITMFDAKNHVSELSSEEIKAEYEKNAKAVGEYVLSLSPQRIALHETIVTMSTLLKVESEDDFVDTFHKIYNEQVSPAIEENKKLFDDKKQEIQTNVENQANLYFNGQELEDETIKSYFDNYSEKYSKNLLKYEEEIEQLSEKFANDRPSRDERAKMESLKSITSYMKDNKERIVVDLTINAQTLQANKELVTSIVSGENGIFYSEYMDQFNKLTQHSKETRQAYLVVGGAASGKGGVTENVKNSQKDPNDLLEINPDLYKKLLLPFSEVKGYEEMHAAITHVESAMVFDQIADKWQNMALDNNAPNILMDVQRAGNWQLGVLGTGDTSVSASSPVLPISTALDRAYMRGVKTGRFVPTEDIIRGHLEQRNLNLNAMKKGVSFKFYDTNVNFGDPSPLIAEYNKDKGEMKISNMGAMFDYFSKGELNPYAKNLDTLSFASPKTTVKSIIDHSEFMDIKIVNQEKEIAYLNKKDDTFCVLDWDAVKSQMGEAGAENILQGLYENNIKLSGDKSAQIEMDKLASRIKDAENNNQNASKNIKNMEVEAYAQLLTNLVEEGIRVGKTESIYIYDFAMDDELKNKNVIIETKNLDVISEEAKEASFNTYDPQKPEKKQMIMIMDPKVYNTAEKRESLISQMKETLKTSDKFSAEGIYMNERGKLNDDYINTNSSNQIAKLKPNPNAIRVAYEIKDAACRIPVQWDSNGYAIEKNGSVVIREADMNNLKSALASYNKDKDPKYLVNEEGKAILDIYGTDPFFIQDNYSNIYSESNLKKFAEKILTEGKVFESKNAVIRDNVSAYQLKDKESLVMPDSQLLSSGDWLSVDINNKKELEKNLDLGLPITQLGVISNETISKSYSMSGGFSNFSAPLSKDENTIDDKKTNTNDVMTAAILAKVQKAN